MSPIRLTPPITGDGAETAPLDAMEPVATSAIQLLNAYAPILLVAFLVTLLTTPLIRRVAIAGGVVDHPDESRKTHRAAVPYLGGLAVFLGIAVAIALSYVLMDDTTSRYAPVPLAVVIGLVAITFTGLADDVWGWDPRLKIAGQLVAAAALAIENIGVRVADGVLGPAATWLDPVLGTKDLVFMIPLPGGEAISIDVIYWTGTAIIAIFVLGGCNAANLIDGLDGLLSGTVAIMAVGLLAISILMAVMLPAEESALAGTRIILCFALLGAVLGFLPHNFNPATVFLGDCGSLLLGYVCIVVILMFGERGMTHLVFAGLIIYSLPIMDTTLAIIRRKLAGTRLSAADDQHIHHQLRRALGGVKKAVFALYAIAASFTVVGVALAALVMLTTLRVRVVYVIAIVLFGFVGVIAVKAARRAQLELAAKRAVTNSRPTAVTTKPKTTSASPGSPPAKTGAVPRK